MCGTLLIEFGEGIECSGEAGEMDMVCDLKRGEWVCCFCWHSLSSVCLDSLGGERRGECERVRMELRVRVRVRE